MKRPGTLPGLMRFLYTQNPFYAISAGLVLYGIRAAFQSDAARADDPWLLALALCGYTSLMAIAAVLVVKLGKVWEDARSIVLILLFQFAAISMSFDRICAVAPRDALRLLSFGFVFSALITEGIIGLLRLRFPALFRIPYYAFLSLMFFYPLCVSPEGLDTSVNAVSWKIYLFPVLAGVIFLTLIPAARRGAAYVAKNGTPWSWPLYPWTAFAFLAFAVGVRSYVLAYSFGLMGMQNAFGGYYLAPLLLALLFLLAEVAVQGRHHRLQTSLMVLAPAILLLSIPWRNNFVYTRFLQMFTETVGSPIWLALMGLVVFYAYAWWRRLRGAEFGVMSMLALTCCVGRATVDWSTVASLQWWPLAVIGLVQFSMALHRRSSLRGMTACISLVAASSVALRGTFYVTHGGVIPVHLLMGCALMIGLIRDDRFALLVRRVGAACIGLATLVAVLPLSSLPVSDSLRLGYAVVTASVAVGYWVLVRDRWWLYSALLNACGAAYFTVWWSYWQLEASVGPAVGVPLAGGALCFLIAAGISAAKAGLWKRLRTRLPTVLGAKT